MVLQTQLSKFVFSVGEKFICGCYLSFPTDVICYFPMKPPARHILNTILMDAMAKVVLLGHCKYIMQCKVNKFTILLSFAYPNTHKFGFGQKYQLQSSILIFGNENHVTVLFGHINLWLFR